MPSACAGIFKSCLVPILILMIINWVFFKAAKKKKTQKKVNWGPGEKKTWKYDHREKTSNTISNVAKQYTCSCGSSVKPEDTNCPVCGKSRDEAILDTESFDIPTTDDANEDPLSEGMIDLDDEN